MELIKEGMYLEAHHELEPTSVWLVKVVRNVGGRLLLRYVGCDDSADFWLFYTDYRLHALEYGYSEGQLYIPPEGNKTSFKIGCETVLLAF